MPYCAILQCKNDSRRKNLKNGGVSYHRFPKDGDIKGKWIDATGRVDWMPVKSSTICSEHFLEDDFIISKNGLKYTKPNAIPTLRTVRFYDQENLNVTNLDLPKPTDLGICHSTPTQPNKKIKISKGLEYVPIAHGSKDQYEIPVQQASVRCLIPVEENILPCGSTSSTPRRKKLKGQLRFCQNKIERQDSKIRRLQSTNRRLKKKINKIDEVLASLEEKYSMSKENLDCLRNTNLEVQEMIARTKVNTESGVISRKKYSPALRSFALTLHYYSPKAYEYVRQTFATCLPHTRTLKSWYAKIGGDAGFTKESLDALKFKAESCTGLLLATLVIDEMSIRRRVEWDGRKFHGYVNMGTGIEGDHLAEAKEALVFLVTALNSNFKVPVGFFLVDGVSGQQRADLVKICLELIHKAGVRIVALTFDGCAANISMAKHLGCSFEENEVCFQHPVTKDLIVTILDPCHMIKLLRNTFEMCKSFIDIDGNKIQWQYLVELNKLQYSSTFHLANKLRDRHINFHNERMKVKLATQLFSKSVADAITLCRKSGNSLFEDSEATEFFLLMINNIFDVFNSRNLHLYKFKKALNEANANEIFEFLKEASNYLKNLKMEDGTYLINSRRKTGFLGFLGCIKALEFLYASLIQTKILIYLPFYKLSQDHLELLFCNIRAQGGSNNNPTARQFVSAYKKMLIHIKLKDTNKGNCAALEQISILECTSAVERINQSINQDVSEDEQSEDMSEIEELGGHFCDFSNQAIGYIAGYIVRMLIKSIKCDVCAGALVTHHFHLFHKFIIAKDQGGLLYPSPDVVKICQTTETFLKNIEIGGFRKEVCINQIMRKFIGTQIFNDIASHQLGEFPTSNHVTDLIKAIVEKYVNVRIHHLLKLKTRLSKRQFLNKYILFQGQ